MVRSQKIDYGLDAPGLVKWFIFGGALAMIVGGFAVRLGLPRFFSGLLLPGVSFLVTGFLMVFYSVYGKFRARDDLLCSLRLEGAETLLDLGCGRGLMLIGAAKRLSTGKAIGIDLWSTRDLSGNSKRALLENAEREGVTDRIQIIEGDMRILPLPDESIDIVVASMSIHNVPSKEGREKAVKEAIRVLKPGGKIALLDFKNTGDYAKILRLWGLKGVRRSFAPWCFPPSRIVFGEK